MASLVSTPDVLEGKMPMEKIADLQKHIDAEIRDLKQEIDDYARHAVDLSKVKNYMSLAPKYKFVVEFKTNIDHMPGEFLLGEEIVKIKIVEEDNKDAQMQAERRMKEWLRIRDEVGFLSSELHEWYATNAKELDKLATPDLLRAIQQHDKSKYQARLGGYRKRKMDELAEDYEDLNAQIKDAHRLPVAADAYARNIFQEKVDALEVQAGLAQYRIDRMEIGHPYYVLGNATEEEPVEE